MKPRNLLPQSLFSRLALLLVCAFLVLHTVIFFTISDYLERHTLQHILANHSASLALCVRLLETEDEQSRQDLEKSLSRLPELSLDFTREKPDMQQGRDRLSLFFLHQLRETLAGVSNHEEGHEHDLRTQVKAIRSGPEQRFPEHLFNKRITDADFTARLVIGLADGQWLDIRYTGYARYLYLQTMPFLVLALEFCILIVLVLLFMHRVLRPLRILAEATEKFGTLEQNSGMVPEEGPREVVRAAGAFNAMRGRIDGIMEERERFFAALAHDLRTPLTRLRLRLEKVAPETLREKLLDDVRGVQSLADMSAAFIHSKRHTERAVHTDIQAFLETIVEDRRAMGHNVRLEGEALFSAWIFPVALRRCMENLLDNAIRYGRQAVMRVGAEESGVSGRLLCVDIEDDGPGVPEEFLGKAFEPFFRVEPSRSRLTGGLGLGLSIALAAAHLHNGALSLHNRPEGGLCARLRIPFSRPAINPA